MWRKFLQHIMDHLPTKAYVVGDSGVLFYRSHLFTIMGWVVYLHHYLRGDPDTRGLHNHPARNWSLILAGGYYEDRILGYDRRGTLNEFKRRKPWSLRYVSEHVFHRVIMASDRLTSWSLFASKYIPGKAWGFMAELNNDVTRQQLGLVDGTAVMVYHESGAGIDAEDPWWTTAPNGKEVRLEHADNSGQGRTESEGNQVRAGVRGT